MRDRVLNDRLHVRSNWTLPPDDILTAYDNMNSILVMYHVILTIETHLLREVTQMELSSTSKS